MAVVPINVARVSQNLRSFNLLETVRRNTTDLFRTQNQLATGLKVITPSDDPMLASAANAVDRRLDLLKQIERNLLHVDNMLTENESAMKDAVELVMEVQTIASETVSDTSSPEERVALARVVDSVLDQLVNTGNRRFLDQYLFAGHHTGERPFELLGDGVLYRGDDGRSHSIVDSDRSQDYFTMSGMEFFNAVSEGVTGAVDLNPALTAKTRISELGGTTGGGVQLGRILVSDGTTETEVDLTGADTVGDLVDLLNDQMPGTLQASFDAQGISITTLGGPVPITVRDMAGGQTARDLGLRAQALLGAVGGADLDPRLTGRVQLADLNGGAGINLAGGLTIRNGAETAAIDFTNAETVEDVLNLINHADVNVLARVGEDGRTISVHNRVSGTDLTIEENGGLAATALGIRSLHGGTELASLNDGLGIQTVDGMDLRITTSNNTTFEVDLDGAATLQDVIDLINVAGGGAVTAGLASNGNGLQITDNTGPGPLRVEKANLSPALDDLGLNTDGAGGVVTGGDPNPIRTDNVYTALVELRDALRADDRQAIAGAGDRLERALTRMQETQGRMASHARAMQSRIWTAEDETLSAKVLLSDVRDVDMADAIVRFQQMQTALEANMTTSSRVMDLSLLDFLR